MTTSPSVRRLLNVTAAGFCLVWIFPVYWMVSTAFKPYGDILRTTPHFLPFPLSLGNFADAVGKPGFLTDLGNSLLVTASVVLLAVVVAFLAAVALTRFRFAGRRTFLITVLVLQMVPLPALVIPLFLGLRSAHLLDSLFGLALTYVAIVLPFTIWTLRGFLHGIPVELEEAAMVDGAGRMTVVRRILLPLVAPGVIATSVFAFITAWNDYLFADVLMKDQGHQTLPVWLVSFSTATGTDYGGLIAASTLSALPVVVFFMVIQRRLVAGMTAGAVKD
ncbi:carbohydrate ABC transporter permease [Streptacidiphilus jiangxiensis]|uniref:N,N'-diacetylchitobiose transport system permease protein n=1 Tax=Streptacidiphilus jiangxiensis TaxID=235985 RepID=A0A1H7U7R5_STRJI|nr:carbohydrate ABC transporter permease [Streptacidiphilus jiangxiensis]SEL93100.1 N,N'-diacetylchitobiose transport system permease protein [Streptacidiphilus jiangxiensis]